MKNRKILPILTILIILISVTIYALAEREKTPNGSDKKMFSPPEKTKWIEVKDGESLSVIAAKLENSSWNWQYLAELNGLENPSLIKPGQKLKIPVK
ncbi:LysM peptidoglycan-binding domain-containing protein [Patescibacteria group bacterium]|nr:LysM peptidoglycan-binding domain-containing protein [Patescibacteria group bacterium]